MLNDIRIERMKDIDYTAICECIGDNPKQIRWKDHPDWGAKLLQFHAPNSNLYVGAYQDNKLVGCMIAHPETLQIRKKQFNAVIIAITEVVLTHRKQEIATSMLKTMLEQLDTVDFVLAFQTAGRGGKTILKRAGFQKIHKYGHAGKALDKEKMDKLMDLNPVLRKIALKIVSSGIGNIKPEVGEIREATDGDIDQIVRLLNQETDRLDISAYWTAESLRRMMNWRYKVFVLVDNKDVLGSIISYEEVATLGKDYFISGLLKEMVFKEDIKDEERVKLINYVLKYFKEKGIPSVSYPYPKNVKSILKKAGFNVLPGDERTAFIKPLTSQAQQILGEIEKFQFVNVFLIC